MVLGKCRDRSNRRCDFAYRTVQVPTRDTIRPIPKWVSFVSWIPFYVVRLGPISEKLPRAEELHVAAAFHTY